MTQSLPVSNYVSVALNLSNQPAQAQNLHSLLILDGSTVIDQVQRIRLYSSLTALAADFGTSGNVYSSALLYLSQVPQPAQVLVGRWCMTAAAGGLKCAPLSVVNQAITVWQAITAGSFTIKINGGSTTNITGLNFSAAPNLSAVAATIQAALTGVTVFWNANYQRFEFTSTATGATSAVAFLGAVGSGTDISVLIGGQSSSSGAYVFQGQIAETALAAVQLFESNFGPQWYALTIPAIVAGAGSSPNSSDHLAVAGFIEATSNKHAYGVTTQEGACLLSSDTTNVGYLLSQAGYRHTMVQYSSSSQYAVASLMGRAITTDWTGNNTAIDLMYKSEPGMAAESLNVTQAAALQQFNINSFVNVSNGTTIIQYGNMSSGDPIDLITGIDALSIDLQNNCYNALYTSSTKISQTESGANQLVNVCENTCGQYVDNGFLAPGVWTQAGFGIISQNSFLPKGFYVFSNPLATQSTADRDARKAPLIQIAGKTAGAFRSINISLTINR